MKRTLAAIAIASFMSSAAFAGDIPSVPGPQPPPSAMTITPSSGDMPISDIAEQLLNEGLSTLVTALTFLTV